MYDNFYYLNGHNINYIRRYFIIVNIITHDKPLRKKVKRKPRKRKMDPFRQSRQEVFGQEPKDELVAPPHQLKAFLAAAHGQQTVLSFYPSFSLSDVLCDPTDFIWRYGISFETLTGLTAFIDGLRTEVFRSFPQLQGKYQEICAQTWYHIIVTFIIS